MVLVILAMTLYLEVSKRIFMDGDRSIHKLHCGVLRPLQIFQ